MLGDVSRTRILSDLSLAEPSVFLSRRRVPGHWQLIDYETADFGGRLLSAGPYTAAPPVRIHSRLPAGTPSPLASAPPTRRTALP